ncbi:MAG: UDP-N-acetylmuramate dehydrogenase [Alphaproteobacteria bacterium]
MPLVISSFLPPLPNVRGRYQASASLGKFTWFRVGGEADVLYKPADIEDLCCFLREKSETIPYTLIGVGSNVLVRDGGIPGVVIRLSKEFHYMRVLPNYQVDVGAGTLDTTLTQFCLVNGIGGLEFLCGIPGSLGGALRMNAGAYGKEMKDCVVAAQVIDPKGKLHHLTPQELGYGYRACALPKDWIFVGARLQGIAASPETIAETVRIFLEKRESTQPVRERTGGSTFTNPPGEQAWKLIDAAGCRGLRVGGAQMSDKHCNFMINTGNATAQDLEDLGELVRKRVLETTGIALYWEIERVGKHQATLS